ncbi:MAG TPA: DNA adenine methylase [Polyangiaceae bacterium]|jgi:DNA adenine methylase|nr:DNA adenine methylase [Polyangiaceae bacterium]
MSRPTLGPVLKWAGGKSQLLPWILARLPEQIDTYYEPFVGGGAVFFALASRQRFKRAVLGDRNPNLVAVYEALQKEPKRVIQRLKRYQESHSEEAYYKVREREPSSLVEKAARVIYLNKTGFNGLYRVNRSGEFNVPFGRYVNPRIVNEPRLMAVHETLKGVQIVTKDFEEVCREAKKGDAVYLDPPYLPVSTTSSFAEYHAEPFGLSEHKRLAKVFAQLSRRGVCAVLSNSDTPDTRRLFDGHRLETVAARRSINSNHKRRGPVDEILVST